MYRAFLKPVSNTFSKSKYHNVRTTFKEKVYMSRKEAETAKMLYALQTAKNPANRVLSWTEQTPFPIVINGHKICEYRSDFVILWADGHTEVWDVKAFNKRTGKFLTTDVYRLKKKLVEACHGIVIKEV